MKKKDVNVFCAWQRVVVQRKENKGLSCFLKTMVMDDWVKSLGGRMLGRPQNGRGIPARTELGRGWSCGGLSSMWEKRAGSGEKKESE